MIAFDPREIKNWADTPDAPHTLPKLIRRLILATVPTPSLIDIPGGSSVWKPGWDGLLKVNEAALLYVPSGASAWEFGVGKNPQSKANKDYRKRTENSLGVDRKSSSFVFVTPRVWSGKRDWIRRRQEENEWATVHAYDADDLATWLEQMPSVADWFARLIGKFPDEGVVCLDDWWKNWASGTRPNILPEVVLAGRSEQSDLVRNWFTKPANSFYVKGDARDEAIAFIAASALNKPDSISAAILAKSIVVESIDAWRSLERSNYPMVLIRNFVGDVSSQSAVAKGHHVVASLDSAQEPRGNGLKLPPLGRDEVVEALKSMGLTEARARALSRKAARRLRVMRRFLLEEAGAPPPEWASPTPSRSLIALVPIGLV